MKTFGPLPSPSADLPRTDWFGPEVDPTIPGTYECATGGGYVFLRVWNGSTWISTVNGQPTRVRMNWRGVKPGGVSIEHYPNWLQRLLIQQPGMTEATPKKLYPTTEDTFCLGVG